MRFRRSPPARLPDEGESVVEQGRRFEVMDPDGRRIDKLPVGRG